MAYNPIEILLSASHDVLGIVMVVYIGLILQQFRGLPRLERPWWSMVGALIVFLVSSTINTIMAFSLPLYVDPPYYLEHYIKLATEIFETIFIFILALSIYFFKKAWEEPK